MTIKRSKYGVRLDAAGKAARTVDGIQFDSLKEAKRYVLLKQLARTGEISELTLQPKFNLHIDGIHLANYVADFTYRKNGLYVVEDVKSAMTKKLPLYRLKKKMAEAIYGIEISEV